jgi:hypothetical protein
VTYELQEQRNKATRRQLREKIEQVQLESDMYKRKYMMLKEEMEKLRTERSPRDRVKATPKRAYVGASTSQSPAHNLLPLPLPNPLKNGTHHGIQRQNANAGHNFMPPIQHIRQSASMADNSGENTQFQRRNQGVAKHDAVHASLALDRNPYLHNPVFRAPASPKILRENARRDRVRRFGSLPKDLNGSILSDMA